MRVPEEAKRCVLFIGVKERGRFLPRATGFFGQIVDQQHSWLYIVTAQHVVSGLLANNQEIWIRTNLKNGGVDESVVPPHAWFFGQPDKVGLETDVAVCPVQITPDEDVLSIALNGPKDLCLSDEDIKKHDIGDGDEVTIVGLFRSHYGNQRNVPVVRIGHLAMLSRSPVHTVYSGYIEAHLVEAMSIGGLSGSPVFVNLGPTRILDGQTVFSSGKQFHLLGVVHGHFDIENLNEDVVTDSAGQKLQGIHTGMGVVVPASKILEALFQEDCVNQRKNALEHEKSKAAKPDLSFEEASPPANDANPNHQEDFTRLVGAAAQKPEREG